MEKLFEELRKYLDDQEQALSSLGADDLLFALGDLSLGLTERIDAFRQALADAILENPDGTVNADDLETPEPPFLPDLGRLAEAAVLCLALRGDIVGQLEAAGFADHAAAVAALLEARSPQKPNDKTTKKG